MCVCGGGGHGLDYLVASYDNTPHGGIFEGSMAVFIVLADKQLSAKITFVNWPSTKSFIVRYITPPVQGWLIKMRI